MSLHEPDPMRQNKPGSSYLLFQYYSIVLFQISENVPESIKFWKIIDMDFRTDLLLNLIIQINISLCPSIFNVFSSLIQNEESLIVEPYCGELGKVLLLTRGVDFEAKKLLK